MRTLPVPRLAGVSIIISLIIIAFFTILVSIAGCYYFYSKVNIEPGPPVDHSNTLPVSENADELVLAQNIKELFGAKYQRSPSDIIIQIAQKGSAHVRGSVTFSSENAGGNFFAAKVNSVWELVFDGNGGIPCVLLDEYDFPDSMRSDCYMPELISVNLYYYNPKLDQDTDGNILCSEQGLVPVARQIYVINSPLEDTLKLLLTGDLTDEEKSFGLTTEYPLTNFAFTSSRVEAGRLILTFSDPDNRTSGGSCRVGILWHQIAATAKQFGYISVLFEPEYLFQP